MKEMKNFDKWIGILSISVICIVAIVFVVIISDTHLAKGTYAVNYECPDGGTLSGTQCQTSCTNDRNGNTCTALISKGFDCSQMITSSSNGATYKCVKAAVMVNPLDECSGNGVYSTKSACENATKRICETQVVNGASCYGPTSISTTCLSENEHFTSKSACETSLPAYTCKYNSTIGCYIKDTLREPFFTACSPSDTPPFDESAFNCSCTADESTITTSWQCSCKYASVDKCSESTNTICTLQTVSKGGSSLTCPIPGDCQKTDRGPGCYLCGNTQDATSSYHSSDPEKSICDTRRYCTRTGATCSSTDPSVEQKTCFCNTCVDGTWQSVSIGKMPQSNCTGSNLGACPSGVKTWGTYNSGSCSGGGGGGTTPVTPTPASSSSSKPSSSATGACYLVNHKYTWSTNKPTGGTLVTSITSKNDCNGCEEGYAINNTTLECAKRETSSSSVEPTEPVNPPTGMSGIVIAWIIGIFAIGYSFWYFKRTSTN